MTDTSTPLVTSAARRGCGYRQPGGAYFAVPLGPGGRPIEEFLVDPPIVIDRARLALASVGVTLIERDGVTHVLDIVGREHYPAVASFIDEVRRLNISRGAPRTIEFERITASSRLLLAHAHARQRRRVPLRRSVSMPRARHLAAGFAELRARLWWHEPLKAARHRLALFASFPIPQIEVVKNNAAGSHMATALRAHKLFGHARPELTRGPARGDQRKRHLLVAPARFGDLREHQLPRRVGLEPASGEVETGLRIGVGPVLANRRRLELQVDDRPLRLAVSALPERLQVQVAEDGPLELGRERELEPALDVDGIAEVRDELGHRQLDRLTAEREGLALGQLHLPIDILRLPLGVELGLPRLAVDVEHLVHGEPVAVLEDPPVVGRQRVVDAAAQEHRAGRQRPLALDVAPAPRLRAADP